MFILRLGIAEKQLLQCLCVYQGLIIFPFILLLLFFFFFAIYNIRDIFVCSTLLNFRASGFSSKCAIIFTVEFCLFVFLSFCLF